MKKPLRIVIVGGVAGGASAAAKARRVDEIADIQIFERGPYISFANCGLPYFIAGEIDDRAKLIVMTPERFWDRSRVRAHVNHEVLSINRAAKTICVKEPDGRQRDVPYDKLVLSQGAKAIVPPIPGANLPHVFTLRDIPDMDRIAAFINEGKPRHAVVIGGGFIGLEMAEAFHHRGLHVTIVERNPHILPLLDRDMAAHLQNQIRQDDFDFKTSVEAARFTGDGVEFADGSRLPADLILMSVGVKAEVELARAAGLEIGETGGVKTNGRLESSDPNIYAVGDAAETMHALTGRTGAHCAGRPGQPPGTHRRSQRRWRAPHLSRSDGHLHRAGSEHDGRFYRPQQRPSHEGGLHLFHQPDPRQQPRALLSRRKTRPDQNRCGRRHRTPARRAGPG